MENIKKMFVAASLTTVLMLGSTVANGGIIVHDFNNKDNSQTCTSSDTARKGVILSDSKSIILSSLAKFIMNGFTGIIVSDVASNEQVNCGIIVHD
jgi:hypothetical protein